MIRSTGWRQGVRMLAILALLGAAAFPLYWMFVTSMTPSSELFAPSARLVPKPSEIGVYREAFHGTSVKVVSVTASKPFAAAQLQMCSMSMLPRP